MAPNKGATVGSLSRMMVLSALLVLALVGLVNTAPIISHECPESAKLKPGQEFVYAWEGENVLKNLNAEPRLLSKAVLRVTVQTPCWVSLKFSKTSLSGVSEPERNLLQAELERETVWLRLEEGSVTSVRHQPSASQWAVNVMRAIASSIQMPWEATVTETVLTEKDVLGSCDTVFSALPMPGGQTSITKIKSLASCADRVGSPRISAFSIPYDSKASVLQSVPLTHGNYSCTITVNEDKWVTKSECVQKELLLVSVSSMAADELWSLSRSSLSLLETTTSSEPLRGPDGSLVETTLMFDHNIKMDEVTSEREALSALEDLCNNALVETMVKPEASEAFSRLVQSLRGLSYDTLTRVHSQAQSGEFCVASGKLGSLFIDALSSVGTEAAIKHQLHLIHQEPSNFERFKLWLTSMALNPQPSDGVIEAFVPYVKSGSIPQVMLVATSVAHTFCQSEPECDKVPAVRDLITALSKQLGHKCSSAEEKRIVIALKAFGNLGVHGDALNSVLECAIAPQASMEVRLAAVASFRRTCNPVANQKLLEIYSSSAEDPELRIMAYLSLMKCADYDTMTKIMEIHNRETINQVGALVNSHLYNLQDSDDPQHKFHKSYLSRIALDNKWSSDPRKFSRNFQFSKFNEPWNLGGSGDMNLVFSHKSYVPRSLSLNLTVNLFSRSINLFEIGGRVENIEPAVEYLVQAFEGKNGDLFDGLFGPKLRKRRSVPKSDVLDSKVNYVRNEGKDAYFSVYSRIFGNELSYLEPREIMQALFTTQPPQEVPSSMSNDIVKSGMLIDTSLCMSTLTGFPLRMSVNATSTVALKTEVNFKGSGGMGVEGLIQPSAVVDMNSEVSIPVGSRGYRRGVRVSSRLHAATILSGQVKMDSRGELSIKIDTPRDDLQVASVRSTFFVVEGETAERVAPASPRKELDGCTQTFDNVLGLQFCIQGSVPKPFFGPQGVELPYDLTVSVKRTDPGMQGYVIQALRTYAPLETSYSILLDTPGSAINRKIEMRAQVELHRDDSIPFWKSFVLQTSITDVRRSEIRFATDINDPSENPRRFTLSLDADCRPVSLDGPADNPLSVFFTTNWKRENTDPREADFELSARLPYVGTSNFKGVLRRKEGEVSADLIAGLPQRQPISLKGLLSSQKETATASIDIGDEADSKSIAAFLVNVKSTDDSVKSRFTASGEMKLPKSPEWNTRITADIQKHPGVHREYDFNLLWGANFEKTARVLAVSKAVGEWAHGQKGEAQNRLLVVIPPWDLDADLRVDTEVDLTNDAHHTRQNGKILWKGETIAESNFEFNNVPPVMKIRSSIMFPGAKMSYSDEITKTGPNQYNGNTVIEWGFEPDNKKVELEYRLKATDPAGGAIVNHELETSLKMPGSEKPIVHKQKIRVTREAVDISMQADQPTGEKFVNVDVKWTKDKSAEIDMETPGIKVIYKRVTEGVTTDISMDLWPKRFGDRKIAHTAKITSDPAVRHYAYSSTWLWNAEKDANQKLVIDFDTQRKDRRKTTINFEHMNLLKFTWRSDLPPITQRFKGQSSIEWKLGGTMAKPREFTLNFNREPALAKLLLKYNRAGKELMDIDYERKTSEDERTFNVKVKSVNTKGEPVGWTFNSKRALKGHNLEAKLVAEPSGRTYEVLIDDKSADGTVNNKMRFAYPFRGRWVNHEYVTTGTYADGTVNFDTTFTAAYHNSPQDLNDTPKKYQIKGTLQRPKKRHLTIDGTITSLDEPHKTGTVRLHYALDATPVDKPAEGPMLRLPFGNVSYEAELKITLGGETMFDYAAKYKYEDMQTLEGKGRVSSRWSPGYSWSFDAKADGDGRKYTFRLKKGDQEDYIKGDIHATKVDNKYKMVADWQSPRLGKIHASVERSVLAGDNHRQYNIAFNADKLPEPYVIEAETQREEGMKVTTLNVCRGKDLPQCVGIHIKRNVDWDFWRNKRAIVKITQQPDMTVQIDYLLKIEGHEGRHKLIFDVNNKKLGHDFTCTHEPGKLSRQHLLAYMAEREMEFLRERKTDDKSFEITYTGALNKKEMPDRKALIHYKRNYLDNDGGYNSEATISHPAFGKPITFKGSVLKKPDEHTLFKIEAELDPASPENAMHFHLQRRINDITPRNRSIHVHLHHHDKNVFDWSMTAYRCSSLELPIFGGYWWHYRTAKGELRQGHMTIFRGEDGKGRVEIASPYQGTFVVESEAKAADADGVIRAELTVTKDGQPARTGEVAYKISKAPPMVILNATTKTPDGKNARAFSFKFAPEEGDLFGLEVSSFPNDQKTLDIRASIERRGQSMYRTQLYFPPSYINHLREVMKGAAEKAGHYPIDKIKEEIQTRVNSVKKVVNNKIRTPLMEFLVDETSQLYNEATGAINDILETNVGKRWSKRFERVREILKKICDRFREEVQRIREQKRTKRSLPSAQLISKLAPLRDYLHQRIMEWFEGSWLSEKLDRVSEWIADKINVVSSWISRVKEAQQYYYEQWIQHSPDIQAIIRTWEELYQPSWPHAKSTFFSRLASFGPSDIASALKGRTRVIVWDPARGAFAVDIDAPTTIEDIQQLLSTGLNHRHETKKVEVRPKPLTLLAVAMHQEWMPPFDARAAIINGRHFITFDGRTFSALGDCVYLLSRDFDRKNFALFIRYGSGGTVSYILNIANETMELFPEKNAVTLNDKPAELPIVGERGVLAHRNHDLITVGNVDLGIQITCYLHHDVCTVDLNGWKFGKTRGLLGTYDNEPSNDLMRPQGQLTGNIGQFMRKWEMEKECPGRPRDLSVDTQYASSEALDMCNKAFKTESSPLAIGFWLRNPESFYQLCLRQVSLADSEVEKQKAVCQTSMAYVLSIKPLGLSPSLPDECMMCEMEDGEGALAMGEARTVSDSKKRSADIVFLVEEAPCNAPLINELDSTVSILERELAAVDIKHNRYALMSFGQHRVPVLRTARDRVFFPARDLSLAADKMSAAEDKSASYLGDDLDELDIFGALASAVDAPWRPGVAKTVVLVACSKCDDSVGMISYSDLQRFLLDHGISLHVVGHHNLRVKNSEAKSKGLLGFDAESVYSLRDMHQKTLVGQPDLLPHVSVDFKDLCVALARETHGSYFSAHHPLNGKEVKSWKTVVARRLARGLQTSVDEETCQVCECAHSCAFTPRTVCRPCTPRRAKLPKTHLLEALLWF